MNRLNLPPRMRIPPNGIAGTAQQTPATLTALSGMSRGTSAGPRRRRKARKAARAAPRRARRASSKRPARLVKGSAAAKRYMASIRRKRKR